MSASASAVLDEPAWLGNPCSCGKEADHQKQCQECKAQNAPEAATAAESNQSGTRPEQVNKDSPCPRLINGESSAAAGETVSICESEAHSSTDMAGGMRMAAAAEDLAAAAGGVEDVAQRAGSKAAGESAVSAEAADAFPADVTPGSVASAAAVAAALAAAASTTTTDDAPAAVPTTTADNPASSDGKPPTSGSSTSASASASAASAASSSSRAPGSSGTSRPNSRPSSRPGSRPSSRPSSRSSSPAPDEPVVCRVACMSWAGQQDGFHKTNQDAYCFMRTKDKKSLIFGVFDGHGPQGHDVSKFIKDRLPEMLMDGTDLLTDPEKALSDGFLAVHSAALEETSFDCNISGTTAVVAHLYKQRLAVAWVGDSRAVLARRREGGERDDLMAVRLSADHKPDNEQERARIEASEGSVQQDVDENGDDVGPFRVWMKTGPMLGLAMSRSLGDKLAHTVGVSATPEVVVRRLDQSDAFLVLGSDGLWEWVADEEAVQVVVGAGSIEAGVKGLLGMAKERWLSRDGAGYVDDITALVVGFTHRKV
ncbi:hypothetical protein CLOM_g11809 [Closterium sp. NIES-68]|nr:hypothetical protein CLOM_g11809 [Closterium sp. NIES-68]GJP63762.1 hypothetical protein CLOP_g20809 [Closterium sp. NIES-67]